MSVVIAGLMVLSSIHILLGVMYKKMNQMAVQMPMPIAEAEEEMEEEVNRLNELISEYIKQRNSEEMKVTEEQIEAAANKELESLNIKPKKEKAVVVLTNKGSTNKAAKKADIKMIEKRTAKVVVTPDNKKAKNAKVIEKPEAPNPNLKKPKAIEKPAIKKPKVAKRSAVNLLPIEKSFFFKDLETGEGAYARSLDEFHYSLQNAPQETFDFHLREDQNDFSNWLKHILNEHELAQEIDSIKTEHGAHKEKIVGAVQKRLSEMRKVDFL